MLNSMQVGDLFIHLNIARNWELFANQYVNESYNSYLIIRSFQEGDFGIIFQEENYLDSISDYYDGYYAGDPAFTAYINNYGNYIELPENLDSTATAGVPRNAIEGTESSDFLIGTAARDLIQSYAGNDEIGAGGASFSSALDSVSLAEFTAIFSLESSSRAKTSPALTCWPDCTSTLASVP
jgi:Ca2+-binding RTX toxin-like protein